MKAVSRNSESLATQQERELATVSPSDPHNSNETNFRTQYAQKLGVVAAKLRATSSMQKNAHECVINRLPTFVYMDEYRTFRGTAYLDPGQTAIRYAVSRPMNDQTLITILNLAELNLTSERDKG